MLIDSVNVVCQLQFNALICWFVFRGEKQVSLEQYPHYDGSKVRHEVLTQSGMKLFQVH